MKKIAVLLLVAIMIVFAAASCGPKNTDPKPGTPSAAETETAPIQTELTEEPAEEPSEAPQTTEEVDPSSGEAQQATEEPDPDPTEIIPEKTDNAEETDYSEETGEEEEGGLEVDDETIIEIGDDEGAGSL